MKRLLSLVATTALLPTLFGIAPAMARPDTVTKAETPAERDARMKWWREARFGMFIHWGLYAIPAGVWNGKHTGFLGEWIMNSEKIPVADYAALAPQFNPTEWDADKIARLAKGAGMKYIVITAKHHDGFALFPSAAGNFNVKQNTPFQRDPIGELAAACKKQGLKFGVYYSQAQDWHQPGGGIYNGGEWDPAQKGDLSTYIKTVAAPQVTELVTRYKPAILWWDTPVQMTPEDIQALTASFQQVPGIITNNRLGNGVLGDTETPEQTIPATGFPGRDWETCMTINDTWGYRSDDNNFKPTKLLIRNLVDIASKGGNYLLNIGPDAKGVVPQPEIDRLEEMGKWLKANGESIYGTTASPYRRLPFSGRVTRKGSMLYVHLFDNPGSAVTLTGIQGEVRDAKVLATGHPIQTTRGADGTLTFAVPFTLDPNVTTIAIRFKSAPVITDTPLVLSPDTGGSFALKATDANLNGSVQVEGATGSENIGFWTNEKDSASWQIKVSGNATRTYTVALQYSCAPDSAGSTFAVEVDGKPAGLTGTVAATKSWSDYQTMTLEGTLSLTPGVHTMRIVPLTKPNLAVMNLRKVTITPVTQ